jgi:hypothetical protein
METVAGMLINRPHITIAIEITSHPNNFIAIYIK